MRKLKLSVLTVLLAFCLALGMLPMSFVNTAHAINTPGIEPTLSATKARLSKDNGKMLLVTAIKNYVDVYEIGYEFTGESPTKVSEEKHTYYTSISDGKTTVTAEDLFGGEFSGAKMIIWEIVCESGTAYIFNAYALVGDRTEGGDLVETETKVTNASVNKKFVKYPFDPVYTEANPIIDISYLELSLEITAIKVGGVDVTSYADISGAPDIEFKVGFPKGEDLELIFETANETVATKITIL